MVEPCFCRCRRVHTAAVFADEEAVNVMERSSLTLRFVRNPEYERLFSAEHGAKNARRLKITLIVLLVASLGLGLGQIPQMLALTAVIAVALFTLAFTNFGSTHVDRIAAVTMGLLLWGLTMSGLQRLAAVAPGKGRVPGTNFELPFCGSGLTQSLNAISAGSHFASRAGNLENSLTWAWSEPSLTGMNATLQGREDLSEHRYSCLEAAPERFLGSDFGTPRVLSIEYRNAARFDASGFYLGYHMDALAIVMVGSLAIFTVRLGHLNAVLAVSTPTLVFFLFAATLYDAIFSGLVLCIHLPIALTLTLTPPYVVERGERTIFLRNRRIERLMSEKNRLINEQADEIVAKQQQLLTAQKMVVASMREARAVLHQFEIAFRDLEWEGRTKLGEGAFGTVFKVTLRATRKQSERTVAVKTMRVSKVTERALAGFKNELIIMCPLHHPNLVQLVGGVWNEGADKLCIVLEFCARGSLRHYLLGQRGSWQSLRHGLATGCASGLCYLHHGLKDPLIHRDIKPDNILVSEDDAAKLADFGASAHFNAENARRHSGSDDAYTMTMVGTMIYCAPEDTYSFALVLLCLAVGDIDHMWDDDFQKRPASRDVLQRLQSCTSLGVKDDALEASVLDVVASRDNDAAAPSREAFEAQEAEISRLRAKVAELTAPEGRRQSISVRVAKQGATVSERIRGVLAVRAKVRIPISGKFRGAFAVRNKPADVAVPPPAQVPGAQSCPSHALVKREGGGLASTTAISSLSATSGRYDSRINSHLPIVARTTSNADRHR